MQLINCEVNLILTWSPDCVIIYINVANQIPTFVVTPVVIFSIQDNAKILTHLKSDFKRTIQSKEKSIKTRIISTKSKLKSPSWTKFSRRK